MANTATITGSLTYTDPKVSDEIAPTDVTATISTIGLTHLTQSITTSQVAINLGGLTTPTWAMFVNRDATNYIELKVATSGAVFAKLLPGEFCLLRLGSGAQVPFAIANSSACIMEVFLCNL